MLLCISDSVGPDFGQASPAGWVRARFREIRGQAEPGEEPGFSHRGTREPWENCEQVCDMVHRGSGSGLTVSRTHLLTGGCLGQSPLESIGLNLVPQPSFLVSVAVDTGTKACSQPAQLPATRVAERRTGGGVLQQLSKFKFGQSLSLLALWACMQMKRPLCCTPTLEIVVEMQWI